jgi:hypothetical protein
MSYQRPGPKTLGAVAIVCLLLVVAFFTLPTLMGAVTTSNTNPAAALKTTHDRDVAKSGNPT